MMIRVPCSTANLGPGIDCLGIALDRYLTVEAVESDGVRFVFSSGFDRQIPDADNLFLVAAIRVFELAERPFHGVKADMTTQIPVSRGLASSAAAIVAGAIWANETLQRPFTTDELIFIASGIEGHPDNIVPCMLGGFTTSMLESGGVSYFRQTVDNTLTFVAAIPDFMLSTHDARAILPTEVSLSTAVTQLQHACFVQAAMMGRDYRLLRCAMADLIFTPARKHLIPGFDDVSRAALDQGALALMISGAGPTVIALTKDNQDAIALAMQASFRDHGVQAETAMLLADNGGTRIG